MPKRPPLSFDELDKPKGRGAILRSAEEIAAENREGDEEFQEIQNSIIKDEAVSKKKERAAKRASYQKATYRLSPEAIEAVEDMRRTLRRTYKIDVLLEEVVEEALLTILEEFEENKEASFLVSKFSGNQEKRKS